MPFVVCEPLALHVLITHAANILQMIESDVQKSGLETTERAQTFSHLWQEGFCSSGGSFSFLPSRNQASASLARHLHLTRLQKKPISSGTNFNFLICGREAISAPPDKFHQFLSAGHARAHTFRQE